MLNLSSLNQRVNALTSKINNITPPASDDLDAVLTAGNTADNSIILSDGTDNTTFNKNGLTITNTAGSSTHTYQLLNLVETGVGSAILNPNALTIIDTQTTGGSANPLLLLQNTNTTAGGTTFETYKNDTPTSSGGDEIGIWSATCNTSAGSRVEIARITQIAYGTTSGNNDGGIRFGCKVNGTLNKMLDINGGVGTGAIQVFKPIQASGTGSTNIVLDATSSAGNGNINLSAKGDVEVYSNGAGGVIDINAVSNVNITATGDNLTMTAGTAVLIEATGTNASIQLKPESSGGDIIFTGANLESGSAGGNTGNHLRIKLNGVYYKIKLEAD